MCLTDEAIATLADGSNGNVDHFVLEHLAACAECRARAVAVTQLLNNADVMSAIQALEQPRRVTPRNWSRRQVAVTFAAAAAVAFVIAGPAGWLGNTETAHTDDPPHRDPTLTAAAAPRIVSPPTIAVGDSLRWTRVPESDLYRVRIWNSEGTVIWTVDTRDTSVAVPPSLTPGARFLWEVDARTGWERWVSSDLFAVTMRGARTR